MGRAMLDMIGMDELMLDLSLLRKLFYVSKEEDGVELVLFSIDEFLIIQLPHPFSIPPADSMDFSLSVCE